MLPGIFCLYWLDFFFERVTEVTHNNRAGCYESYDDIRGFTPLSLHIILWPLSCSGLSARVTRCDAMISVLVAHALRSEPGVVTSWPRQILNGLCSLLNRTSGRNLPHRP